MERCKCRYFPRTFPDVDICFSFALFSTPIYRRITFACTSPPPPYQWARSSSQTVFSSSIHPVFYARVVAARTISARPRSHFLMDRVYAVCPANESRISSNSGKTFATNERFGITKRYTTTDPLLPRVTVACSGREGIRKNVRAISTGRRPITFFFPLSSVSELSAGRPRWRVRECRHNIWTVFSARGRLRSKFLAIKIRSKRRKKSYGST